MREMARNRRNIRPVSYTHLAMSKLEEAKVILRDIGMPSKQQNDLCAYTLLALLNIKNEGKWNDATNEYIRIQDVYKRQK